MATKRQILDVLADLVDAADQAGNYLSHFGMAYMPLDIAIEKARELLKENHT